MTETLVSWCGRSAEPRDRPALLEVSGLTKSYGPLTVLRGVTSGLEPVWADHDRLEQVFGNLLENAASHGASPRGTDVTVRAGGAPGWAEVEITAYGPGIPAGLAEKIFEPRVRGTTEVAGTGLGLPIARGIVEAHGGALVVAPAAPGASFVVALPADSPSGTAEEPAGASWNVVEEPEGQRGG
jgi:signal transduction histidine kinase